MIKVLIITGTLNYGGVERLLLDYVKILASDKKYKVTVCNLSGSGELVNELLDTNVKYVSLDQKVLSKNIVRTIFNIRQLIKNIHPDIIHTHQFASDFYAGFGAVGPHTPLVFHLHNTQLESWSRRVVRWVINRIFADAFIVSTEIQKNMLIKNGLPENKIFVLHNALDPKNMQIPQNFNSEEYKKQLKIPKNRFVIGSVGRLAPEKGYDLLIQAVEQLVIGGLDLSLILVGSGPEEIRLKSLAHKIGMTGRVIFAGYRRDVINLMSLFDIFVASSRSESFSIATIEAMFLKKPVIITDRFLSRELFVNAALIVPVTISGIKDGLKFLYHNKLKRIWLAEKGKELVKEKFTIDGYVEKLKIIYDNILRQ